jgi:hypothetical protein
MKLSDTSVKAAKPNPDKAYKLFDGNGLYVLITSAGGKYWRFNYRHNGKHKTLSLGTYPDTGLKRAREKRDEARKLLADGICPSDAKKESKVKARGNNSFEAIAGKWIESTSNSHYD